MNMNPEQILTAPFLLVQIGDWHEPNCYKQGVKDGKGQAII